MEAHKISSDEGVVWTPHDYQNIIWTKVSTEMIIDGDKMYLLTALSFTS